MNIVNTSNDHLPAARETKNSWMAILEFFESNLSYNNQQCIWVFWWNKFNCGNLTYPFFNSFRCVSETQLYIFISLVPRTHQHSHRGGTAISDVHTESTWYFIRNLQDWFAGTKAIIWWQWIRLKDMTKMTYAKPRHNTTYREWCW